MNHKRVAMFATIIIVILLVVVVMSAAGPSLMSAVMAMHGR